MKIKQFRVLAPGDESVGISDTDDLIDVEIYAHDLKIIKVNGYEIIPNQELQYHNSKMMFWDKNDKELANIIKDKMYPLDEFSVMTLEEYELIGDE